MSADFLPVSQADLQKRGWTRLDIILVTGDAYVDHPSYGAALIGRFLESKGFKVGIIAQPDWKNNEDFKKLGVPRLFFGVTSGNVDSMVANYTANKRPRRTDEYSPGNKTGLRPDRALIVYTNKLREIFGKVPIVLGGMEASLRRLAHYDYWDNEVRRSILVDAKADILVYGMGEKQALEIAQRLDKGEDINSLNDIRGAAVIRKDLNFLKDYATLPSFEEVKEDKEKFNEAFKITYSQQDPFKAKPVVQKHADRFVVQFPPSLPLKTQEMDEIYGLSFMRNWHPVYKKFAGIKGFETVKFSIISNRGCCGECSFCSLYFHQGRIVQSRSPESIYKEAKMLSEREDFKGTITDIGGPTANLYMAFCPMWEKDGFCKGKMCLAPEKCKNLKLGYKESLKLYEKIRQLPKVKHLFIGSGFRYDLLTEDSASEYLEELCKHYISGQMKVAPEHSVDKVLKIMNKPPFKVYEKFVDKFKQVNRKLDKELYLVNYFITAHPGCSLEDAEKLAEYLKKHRIRPEQIQDFLPLPMTLSGCIYYTGAHPLTNEKVYVPGTFRERKLQRALVQRKGKRYNGGYERL